MRSVANGRDSVASADMAAPPETPKVPPAATPSRLRSALSLRSLGSFGSISSIGSFFSVSSLFSAGSILSIGSSGSVLSIGSSGSVLSIGSIGSILSIGGAGSILRLGRRGKRGAMLAKRRRTRMTMPFASRARRVSVHT